MPGNTIIVMGASAGGVEALTTVVRGLPGDLDAAVFIVLHMPAESPSMLLRILQRATPLAVEQPRSGTIIEHGRIYVARPDHHLLVERGHVHVVRGPRENRHRPAVDPLFRSAAGAYGPRVIGVVLTGTLDDGTAGLRAIKQRGGRAVVQDPQEALFPGMPRSAIDNVDVDHVLRLSEIAPALARLVKQAAGAEEGVPVPDDMEYETNMAKMDPATVHNSMPPGPPSVLSCPECYGVLYEMRDGDLIRFRCRTGHAFSAQGVLAEQSEALERALWAALNTLEESMSLSGRLMHQAEERGQPLVANRFRQRMVESEEHAQVLRRILEHGRYRAHEMASDEGQETA